LQKVPEKEGGQEQAKPKGEFSLVTQVEVTQTAAEAKSVAPRDDDTFIQPSKQSILQSTGPNKMANDRQK
jgi:hypothetical protein